MEKRVSIIVCGLSKDEDVGELHADYIYTIGLGNLSTDKTTKELSDPVYLNEVALQLKDEYLEYTFGLNKLFLKFGLLYKGLSLYFVSDLSSRRTEVFDTFVTVCQLEVLKAKLKSNTVERLIFVGCSERQRVAFSSLYPQAFIERHLDTPTKPSFLSIRHSLFFLKAMLFRLALMFFAENKKLPKNANVFLSRYPMHFKDGRTEEKYGNLVKEADLYLISILTDGLHQNRRLKQLISDTSKLEKSSIPHFLLEKSMGFGSIIYFYLYGLWLFFKAKNITKSFPAFRGYDLRLHFKYEIDLSLLRIPRLFMYQTAIIRFFSSFEQCNFYYYLHEYSYGKFFSYVLSRYCPHIYKIGFQHGPSSPRKLVYFLAKSEVERDQKSFKSRLSIPDKILAEDFNSKLIYERAGYKNLEILSEVPRLAYLKSIRRSKIDQKSILVAAGLHDGVAIFKLLLNEIASNPDKTYHFKNHPKAGQAVAKMCKDASLPNLQYAENHIAEYLSFVNLVIFTYSSVGEEASALGIPVRILLLPSRINESPLYL